jgi:putative ABC transport system substrate-binding protein
LSQAGAPIRCDERQRTTRRRVLGTLSTAFALACAPRAWSAVAKTQRVVRIGLLSIGTVPGQIHRWKPFIEEMASLGYVEGQNVEIRQAFAGGDFNRMSALVAKLVDERVDAIVATGVREIAALKVAKTTIPVVMLLVPDPVGQGFVASLARPGGNVTGFTSLVPGLAQKYVELLHQAAPTATRLAILNLPPLPTAETRREIEGAAAALGVSVFIVRPANASDIERALGQAKSDGAGGIIHPLDGATWPHRRALAKHALRNGLPGIYWDAEYVEAGGLMSYSISLADVMRRAAGVVDKILRGATPAEIPVEQPSRIELTVNMATAKTLGLRIPQSILIRADRVIE